MLVYHTHVGIKEERECIQGEGEDTRTTTSGDGRNMLFRCNYGLYLLLSAAVIFICTSSPFTHLSTFFAVLWYQL